MQTKREAMRTGKILQKRMRHGHWKLRVWTTENKHGLSPYWHCSIATGNLIVYLSKFGGRPRYYCLIKGTVPLSFDGYSYQDPNRAVEHTLGKAQKLATALQKDVDRAISNSCISCS